MEDQDGGLARSANAENTPRNDVMHDPRDPASSGAAFSKGIWTPSKHAAGLVAEAPAGGFPDRFSFATCAKMHQVLRTYNPHKCAEGYVLDAGSLEQSTFSMLCQRVVKYGVAATNCPDELRVWEDVPLYVIEMFGGQLALDFGAKPPDDLLDSDKLQVWEKQYTTKGGRPGSCTMVATPWHEHYQLRTARSVSTSTIFFLRADTDDQNFQFPTPPGLEFQDNSGDALQIRLSHTMPENKVYVFLNVGKYYRQSHVFFHVRPIRAATRRTQRTVAARPTHMDPPAPTHSCSRANLARVAPCASRASPGVSHTPLRSA